MPGIVGIISKESAPEVRTELDSMVRCMLHESFYDSGTFINEQLGLAIGWISQVGSFSAGMPVWSDDKTVCLIFSGEIYGDNLAIGEPPTARRDFGTKTAGWLIQLYQKQGLRFLDALNGWFSGVVIDLSQQQAFLFNDRYGMGRICYHEHDGKFYFSSEAKALLKVLPHLRSLDFKSLGEVYSCGSVLQNRTLFAGVSILPGGSVWSFSKSKSAERSAYFEPHSWEGMPALSSDDYYKQLEETWKRILPRYLPEDERIGLSLTGGVDSRMILAWSPRPSGQLPCYTFSGRYRDCTDVKLARQLAKIANQPYSTIPIDKLFLSQFPALVEKVAYIGEGNLDASGSIDLFVQRIAREIAPIRVTGTNGGELLRRLVMFKPAGLTEGVFSADMERSMTEAAATYAEEVDCHRLSFTAFKQAPWYMNSKFVLERSQITMRLPFCDNELVRLSYQAPSGLSQSNEPALRLIAAGNLEMSRIGTDRGLQMRSIPGIGKARHLLQEFAFKAEYAYDMGMPQWLARADHTLAPLRLENLFLGRQKFHHFRVYYRDELSRYLQEVLLDPCTLGRPYLNKGGVEALVRGHVGGYRNYTVELHKLLTIELMQRQLIEQN